MLERQINSWAASVIRSPPADLRDIHHSALLDIFDGAVPPDCVIAENQTSFEMQVLNLLRQAVAKTIAEGIINCLIVTDSAEANIQLTRIHEHIFTSKLTLLTYDSNLSV